MFEFKDDEEVRRFCRLEDQPEIADNATLRFVQSKLNSKIMEEEEFLRALQEQID